MATTQELLLKLEKSCLKRTQESLDLGICKVLSIQASTTERLKRRRSQPKGVARLGRHNLLVVTYVQALLNLEVLKTVDLSKLRTLLDNLHRHIRRINGDRRGSVRGLVRSNNPIKASPSCAHGVGSRERGEGGRSTSSAEVPGAGDQALRTILLNFNKVSESLVKSFWNLDSIGVCPEEECETGDAILKQFSKSVSFADGRYEVGLLWKDKHPPLMDNRRQAEDRLKALDKRLR
ncbi:hypothetical protein CAPTEDRAFT_215558 [Capitella teleta]|uniref:Uncharacterized protein n=1 Tax=Capitella teleta TaxID=283909 RepID=R7U9F4_CAPTE|nr:hypothetical protein CAPTEDRAFT_215558 [Capitella teleta]|eukprot:ELU02776.1 hypothetical protein CAPTEDRAFT_215558 [Capitella teleta]